MLTWHTVATHCMLGLGVGICANAAARRLGPQDIIDGSPRWMWYTGVVFQALVLPTLVAMAVTSPTIELPLSEWLLAPRSALGMAEARITVGLVAYFGKDILAEQALIYHAHHSACAAMSIGALFVPAAGMSVLLGALALEMGTVSRTAALLRPDSSLAHAGNIVGMTASNLVALALLWNVVRSGVISLALSLTYGVVIVVLLAFRQEDCVTANWAWFRADSAKDL
eukprot:COSAG01_NODE_7691_length_3098_cov_2.071691_1_plen_226_part_00